MNKVVILPVLTLSLLTNCASLKQDATKEIAKKKAKEMVAKLGINQSYIKEGESCKYLGFLGSTDTNKAMQNGGIRYKLFSATDKGTIYRQLHGEESVLLCMQEAEPFQS